MAASAALPGLFFCFAACVLLIFVSVSPPTWNSVTFLNATTGGDTVHFGVFGYTGSGTSIGYDFPPPYNTFNNGRLSTSTIHNLTATLILHPIAAGLSGLAVLFGICGASYRRWGTVFMSLISVLAFLCTLVAWVIDMVLWGIVRTVLRDNGTNAQYGNANWMTLGALVSLFIGFFVGACGIFGSYRKRRYDGSY